MLPICNIEEAAAAAWDRIDRRDHTLGVLGVVELAALGAGVAW
jgi:hypothetical protein